jgi:alanine racemase
VLDALERNGLRPPIVHAANSAATVLRDDAWFDLVRCGITIYGIPPAAVHANRLPLAPALSLHARVAHVQYLDAGARVSYGLRYELPRAGRVAVIPIGYADGVPRDLGLVGGEVLVGGARRRIAGTVTMDQTMIDVGDAPVEPGDEVVLIGTQGDETITADEWAARVGTIAYEIVCGIGPRVPRRYVG